MKRTITIILGIIALGLLLAGCTSGNSAGQGAAVTDTTTAASDLPDNAHYVLDTDQSTLTYGAYRLTGKGHTGTVDISDGTLERADGTFTSGTFTIDMTTITEDNDNTRFLGHVQNEDFFDVENHPTSTITVNRVDHVSGDEYTITGDLTILDTTHVVTFPATIRAEGDTLRATASFDIDRTLWGITYDSGSLFSDLGDRAIKDEIDYTLDLVFAAQ